MATAKYPQLQDIDWLAREISAKPLRQIAEEVGCSYSAVMYASRRFQIDVPHRTRHRYNPDKGTAVAAGLKKRFPNGKTGLKTGNWRHGERANKTLGYVQVRRAGVTKYVHRLAIEEALGRELLPEESVHHINGVRDDNRLENLELWSSSHPPGQRVDDKIEWATDFLKTYAPERLWETWEPLW